MQSSNVLAAVLLLGLVSSGLGARVLHQYQEAGSGKYAGASYGSRPTPYCQDGWTYRSSDGKCVKYEQKYADPKCKLGYTYSGSDCYKEDTYESTPTCGRGYWLNYSKGDDVQCYKEDVRRADYYCDQTGYSLTGSTCEKKDSYPATYKCGAGYTPVGSGRCASYDYVDPTPKCQYGYTLSDDGLKCAKKEYEDASYGCPDGYTFGFGVADDSYGKTPCTKYSVVKPYGSSCPPGSEQGYDKVSQALVCHKIEYADPVRSCYSEYQLQGDKCYKADYKQPAYECPGGYEPSGNGNKCVKTSYTDAYPVCRKGYTYSAGKCESYDSYQALKKCDGGYKLSGDYCRKVYYDEPKYNCQSGYTLEGYTCTKKDTAEPYYECPYGYSQDGRKCSKEKTSDPSYKCESGYSLEGEQCVKYQSPPSSGYQGAGHGKFAVGNSGYK